MLIAYSFNLKDEAQALKNAQWMSELRNQGKHKFLIVHDSRCDPKQIKEILSKSFEIAGALSVRDHWNKWPESANQMWCETARYIEYTLKEPWLWLEPDAIFVKENGLDKLESEYKRGNKPFMGGFVPKFHDSPDHQTGIGIYPGEVIKYAGVMLMSAGEPVPFDLIAAPQVAAQAHFTDLIQHRWSPPANPNPPFTSVEDMKERMTSECVLYHSDKTGSICDVLRSERDKPLASEHGTQQTDPLRGGQELPKLRRHSSSETIKTPTEGTLNNGMIYRNGAWYGATKLDKQRANAAKARAAKALKRQNKK